MKGRTTFEEKRGILFYRYAKEINSDYRLYNKFLPKKNGFLDFFLLACVVPADNQSIQERSKSSRRGEGEKPLGIHMGTEEWVRAIGIRKYQGLQEVRIQVEDDTVLCSWKIFSRMICVSDACKLSSSSTSYFTYSNHYSILIQSRFVTV